MVAQLNKFRNFSKIFRQVNYFALSTVACALIALVAGFLLYSERTAAQSHRERLESEISSLSNQLLDKGQQLIIVAEQLNSLLSEDQYLKNQELQTEITAIQSTYRQALVSYEKILDLKGSDTKVDGLEKQFSLVLSQLSLREHASASATLAKLERDIQTLQTQLTTVTAPVPTNVPVVNAPPASGYARQTVETDTGQFVVEILTADLNSTRVQVETASEGDCGDNCPVASLADYVARSGGFAGINGPYFCPAEYPSCAGKTNSFDTLLMNKNRFYFNSDNNIYSTVPALIFSGSGARLVGQSSEWGRDTGVDAVIASQPLLIAGGNVVFGGDSGPKKGSRGSRSFIAVKDNLVFIGVVRNSTVAEVARVLKVLGVQSALNLDSGGSTAFYVNGKYVAGPGRQTPFGIILVRK